MRGHTISPLTAKEYAVGLSTPPSLRGVQDDSECSAHTARVVNAL